MATMDFAAVLQALNQASGFELYRLRAAIDRVLADPKWIKWTPKSRQQFKLYASVKR